MRTNAFIFRCFVFTALFAACGTAPSAPDAGDPGTGDPDGGGDTTGHLRVVARFGWPSLGRTAFSLKVDGQALSAAFDMAMLAAETQGDLPGRDTVFLPIAVGEHTLEATGTARFEWCVNPPFCSGQTYGLDFSGSATFTATAGGHQVAFVDFFAVFVGPAVPPQAGDPLVKVVDVTVPSSGASLVVQRSGQFPVSDVTYGWVPRANACEDTVSATIAVQDSGAFTVPAATEGYFWTQAPDGQRMYYEIPALNEGEVYPVLSSSGGLLLAPQTSGARTAAAIFFPTCEV